MAIVMSIDGIRGAAITHEHEGWLVLDSFRWGGTRGILKQSSASGRQIATAVAPQLKAVTVTRASDIASPEIWLLMLSSTRKLVRFSWLRTGPGGVTPYMRLELEDALITSMSETAGLAPPVETIELTYTKVTLSVINVGNALSGPQDVVSYTLPQALRA